MYELLLKYFKPGATADIGCGSGRDIACLAANGFETYGFDASEGLLAEARLSYPHIRFNKSELPSLSNIASESFENVLCETVIMHLDVDQIPAAVKRLREILKPGGILYLSWRVTETNSIRDQAGRLYSAFDKDLVAAQFKNSDKILFDKENLSESSGKKIHRIIVQKGII